MTASRRPRIKGPTSRLVRAALASAVALGASGGARAQEDAAAPGISTQQLVDLLVKSHVLTRAQVSSLVQQAQHGGAGPGRSARPKVATAPEPEVPKGTVRVTYVPESTRQEIAAEVKQQVMQDAHDEGWAVPGSSPEWVSRVRISGDVRFRGELDNFDRRNSDPGTGLPFLFPNFGAIDTAANGYDVNPSTNPNLPPLLNTSQNRTRVRLRARLDIAAKVADWIDADIRIATGNDNRPVSTNQTLGTPGDFSKYSLWLDRAFVKLQPTSYLAINAGRSPNPFWTTNLHFDDNVNFDGISGQAAYQFNRRFGGFLNAGAFPVFNSDFNFGTNNLIKTHSHDSYLFAVQGGGEVKITDQLKTKFGAGYFAYSNVAGKLSSPCFDPVAIGSCDSDISRPGFIQYGNTLVPLRNLVQDPANPNGPQPQIFGLASGFDILDLRGTVTLTNFHPIDIVVDGNFVKNLAFHRSQVANRSPSNNLGSNGSYQGGDSGYVISVSVGHQDLEKLWDWNGSIAYKYLETDAVLDALTDADFHLGGTNAKGYILTGNLGIAHNAFLSAKFLSASEVSGQPYSVDVLQLDLNAKF